MNGYGQVGRVRSKGAKSQGLWFFVNRGAGCGTIHKSQSRDRSLSGAHGAVNGSIRAKLKKAYPMPLGMTSRFLEIHRPLPHENRERKTALPGRWRAAPEGGGGRGRSRHLPLRRGEWASRRFSPYHGRSPPFPPGLESGGPSARPARPGRMRTTRPTRTRARSASHQSTRNW